MTTLEQQRLLDDQCTAIFNRHCKGLSPNDRLIVHRVVANIIQHPSISTQAVQAIGPILVECCKATIALRDAEQHSAAV